MNSFNSAFSRQRKLSEMQIYEIIPLKTIRGRNLKDFDILLGESEPFTTLSSSKVANLHPFYGNVLKFLELKFFNFSDDCC